MSALTLTKTAAQTSANYSSQLAESSSYECASGKFQASQILIGSGKLNEGQRLIKSLNDAGVQVLVAEDLKSIIDGQAVFLADINTIAISKAEYQRIDSNDHFPHLTHEAEHAYCHNAAIRGSSKALVEMSYISSTDLLYPVCHLNEIQARLDEVPMIIREKSNWASDPLLADLYKSTVQPGALELAKSYLSLDLEPIVRRFKSCSDFLDTKSLDNLLHEKPLNDMQKHRLLLSKINFEGSIPTLSIGLDMSESGGKYETLGLRLPPRIAELRNDPQLIFEIAEQQLKLFVQRIKEQHSEFKRIAADLNVAL